MRRNVLTALFALTAALAMAVPAKRGQYKTVTMADGSQVKVELRGDEFCRYWQAEDGRMFINDNATGLYKTIDAESLNAKATAKRQVMTSGKAKRAAARRASGEVNNLYTGKKKGLIILVEFADKKFAEGDDLALYKRIANEVGFNEGSFKGSVKDYFLAQSNGQFELDFDVVGSVAMENNYAYYGANTNGEDDYQKVAEMVITACKSVDSEVDFTQYDWDGDGEVDQVYVLYAGHGEASYSRDPNTIWPHEYYLKYAGATYNSNGYLLSYGETPVLDGVTVDTYACGCELGSSESIDGIGTLCHEFSHCLGLPDMYDTSNYGYFGMGKWDIMDQGSYNGDSFCPPNYTSYERMVSGWLNPTELVNDTTVTGMKSLSDNGEAYIIYNDAHKDEYYLMENRQKTGWDAEVPGSGMLILHVDYDASAWYNNTVNATRKQRCTIFPADNYLISGKSEACDAYPYGNNNELTNASKPAATLNNANTDGTYYMNKPITDIVYNEDSTMNFVFSNDNNSVSDYTLPQSYIFYESFDKCDGTGGNDGSYNTSASSGNVPNNADNDGWMSGSSRPAYKCGLFGSSTVNGTATTPEININGEYTLWLKAAPFTDSKTSYKLKVEVAEGDATLTRSSFVMRTGQWVVCKTAIKGTGATKLRFSVNTGRFYLDDVCVGTEDEAGINNIAIDASRKADNRIFSIDGRYVGKNLNALPKGIYIMDGKKILR